jgi:hypothetical protein
VNKLHIFWEYEVTWDLYFFQVWGGERELLFHGIQGYFIDIIYNIVWRGVERRREIRRGGERGERRTTRASS